MFKRLIILPLFFSMLTLAASAQNVFKTLEAHGVFNHLDVGLDAGTTGLGITAALPVGNILRLRAGLNYIPRTNVPMTFNLMSYAGDDLNPGETESDRFDRLSDLLESFTGMRVDNKVDMNAHGTMVDFKMLLDIFPFQNKKWYGTVGFFVGSASVGHIENTIHEAPSLIGVMMYNRLYDMFVKDEFLDKPIYGDVFIDPIVGFEMKKKFQHYGRLGAHLGDFNSLSKFKEGTPYMLTPDENGTIYADMMVNHFKPYVGIGFNTTLSKDKRWNLDVNAGALLWGKPRINTHERYIHNLNPAEGESEWTYGTIMDYDPDDPNPKYVYDDYINLGRDVDDIGGKVGTYVSVAKAMNVFPVLNLRISYKLF